MGSPLFYDDLAPIYDAWQRADGMTPFALVVYDKIDPLLSRGRTPPRSFLDLGCGTGELLLALRRSHPDWRLAGVDASQGMLAVAAQKRDAAGITWVQGDLEGPLPVAGPFDAAGAFYDTLNHVADLGGLARAFAAVASVLGPGAAFFFDLTNGLGFQRWWRGRNRWTGPGWAMDIDSHYDPGTRSGHADITITRGDHARRFGLDERWFTNKEVERALEAAGLAVELSERWSPFDIDAPGKTMWIARKQML